jgi:hypothetical protein
MADAQPSPTEVEVKDWRTNTPFYIYRDPGPRPPGGVDGVGYGPDVQPADKQTYFPEGM